MRFYVYCLLIIKEATLNFDIFSPCSGLIVSGYSKIPKGEHIEKLKTYLNQVINPYKKFKKMYVVDNTTDDFKGLRGKVLIIKQTNF